MGRHKLDEDDKEERLIRQKVMCGLAKKNRAGLQDYKLEICLGITNAARDGTVFRRIARGAQTVSGLKLKDMMEHGIKENLFTEEEVLKNMQHYFENRDDAIVSKMLVGWKEQIEDMTLLALNGSVDTQNKLIVEIQKAIKTIRGVVNDK